jgi:hypothetical protein
MSKVRIQDIDDFENGEDFLDDDVLVSRKGVVKFKRRDPSEDDRRQQRQKKNESEREVSR